MNQLLYAEIVRASLFDSKRWGAYMRGEQPLPEVTVPDVYARVAEGLFYIGDIERAETVSYKASLLHEQQANRQDNQFALHDLFSAALFRNLSNHQDDAMLLWERFINFRRSVSIDTLSRYRLANAVIWEAYALLYLQEYSPIGDVARSGYEGLTKGYGIDPIPERNCREFALAPLLEAFSVYYQVPSLYHQQQVQKALAYYKEQNKEHGRLGYRIIFDLQRSFPNVITRVLPSENPEQD